MLGKQQWTSRETSEYASAKPPESPQPRIPSAENLGGGAERQRCCSSWGNGEEAGWVGVTLIVLTHACILVH